MRVGSWWRPTALGFVETHPVVGKRVKEKRSPGEQRVDTAGQGFTSAPRKDEEGRKAAHAQDRAASPTAQTRGS